jgi:hypothetical protein
VVPNTLHYTKTSDPDRRLLQQHQNDNSARNGQHCQQIPLFKVTVHITCNYFAKPATREKKIAEGDNT